MQVLRIRSASVSLSLHRSLSASVRPRSLHQQPLAQCHPPFAAFRQSSTSTALSRSAIPSQDAAIASQPSALAHAPAKASSPATAAHQAAAVGQRLFDWLERRGGAVSGVAYHVTVSPKGEVLRELRATEVRRQLQGTSERVCNMIWDTTPIGVA